MRYKYGRIEVCLDMRIISADRYGVLDDLFPATYWQGTGPKLKYVK